MNKLFGFLKKVDDNLVKILLGGFIFLIPLWPKLPIKMINYTYIAIRFEDIYVAIMALVFIIQLIRKKVELNKSYLFIFITFWLAVFASTAYGIYIGKTIEFPHLGWLHALRRIEYMLPFFIASSVIKSKDQLINYLKLYLLVVLLVVLYGFGQKFVGFPAVQTMNPEYAKGYILSLTPEARISSTFAGHYDLASYLIFAIPIILTLYFSLKKKSFLLLFILALTTLIFTSSRISFFAYIVTTIVLLILLRKYVFTILVIGLTALLMYTSGDLFNRFLKTIQFKRIIVDQRTGAVFINQNITTKELPAGSFYVKVKEESPLANAIVPTEGIATEVAKINTFKEMLIEQKVNEATQSGKTLSANEVDKLIASLSANLKAVNTYVSDISFATRLQIEWPRALEAFKNNKLLGTGPSSITEATDNDFLRWLGETGLLGTTLFLTILFSFVIKVFTKIRKDVSDNQTIAYGFIFGLIALIINAVYIDVFEASKVAFTFWTMAGLYMGYYTLNLKPVVEIAKSPVNRKDLRKKSKKKKK